MSLRTVAAAIGERQLGLVARRQLLERAIPPTTIDDAVAHGRLLPCARGVYRLPGAPLTPEVRMLARALSLGEGAAYSHRSAAWLWGLVDDAPTRHELSVPFGRRPRPADATVHRSRDLELAIPGFVRGVPVTGVGRTILDCAADPRLDLELLVDAARREHSISPTLLPATIAAHSRQGRPGIGRLREFVVLGEISHSDFERLVARWLRDLGITGWEMHHRIVVPGFGPVEIDFAWPALMVALELEGCDHRLRDRVHDNDTERQNNITLAGFTVLRTTYKRWIRQMTRIAREIEAALVAAEARIAATVDPWRRSSESGLFVPGS